jgi:hypothetical protein
VPTILFIDRFRVVIYVKDHTPPHVHIGSAEHQAIVYLNCPDGKPSLRVNYGFSNRQLHAVYLIVAQNLAFLCRAREEIHV